MGYNGKILKQAIDNLDKPSKVRVPKNQWQTPGQITPINSHHITMQGVGFDAIGMSPGGYMQHMEDGKDYYFPTKPVVEFPMMAGGGYVVTRSSDRKGKTHKVTGPDGTVKYFGDSKLGQHPKDPERKKAFYARHKKNLAGNPYFRAFARKTWAEGGSIEMMNNGGGLLSKSVTCSSCGHSWESVEGGADPLTCHNCGGTVKMQNGGNIFNDNQYIETMKTIYEAGGEMIRRADGSYSRRGLWDNIRANKGSGKKPTKQMLEQEKKINSMKKYQDGSSVTGRMTPQREAEMTKSMNEQYFARPDVIAMMQEQAAKKAYGKPKKLNYSDKEITKSMNEQYFMRPENRQYLKNPYVMPSYADPMANMMYAPPSFYRKGGTNNAGFDALPPNVQAKILSNMARGGERMPPEIARARFVAAGNMDQMADYGYAFGGYIPVMQPGGVPAPVPSPYSREYMQNLQNEYDQFYAPPKKYKDDGFDEFYYDKRRKAPLVKDLKGPGWVTTYDDGFQTYADIDQIPLKDNAKRKTVRVESYDFGSSPFEGDLNSHVRTLLQNKSSNRYKPAYMRSSFQTGGEPNGEMAMGQMAAVSDKMAKLLKFIKPQENLDPWIASKLAVMDHSADAISDYLTYGPEAYGKMEKMQDGGDMSEMPSPEEIIQAYADYAATSVENIVKELKTKSEEEQQSMLMQMYQEMVEADQQDLPEPMEQGQQEEEEEESAPEEEQSQAEPVEEEEEDNDDQSNDVMYSKGGYVGYDNKRHNSRTPTWSGNAGYSFGGYIPQFMDGGYCYECGGNVYKKGGPVVGQEINIKDRKQLEELRAQGYEFEII